MLDQLAEEFAQRFRRGERSAVKEYADRYPELADDIRELFPAMAKVEQVEGDRKEMEQKETAEPRAATRPPALIGDYRIVREVGRGGMGVVYHSRLV